MTILHELNILHNKKLAIILNLLNIPLIFIFIYFFTWVGNMLGVKFEIVEHTYLSLIYFLPVYIFLIIIHELIHGLFFKLFSLKNKVKFGFKWKQGMAYAISPGSLYNRKQMLLISLAPFMLISLALTILAGIGIFSGVFYILLSSVHAAGCIGDFYYTYLLAIKYRNQDILAEDTETGLIIYQV